MQFSEKKKKTNKLRFRPTFVPFTLARGKEKREREREREREMHKHTSEAFPGDLLPNCLKTRAETAKLAKERAPPPPLSSSLL